MTRTQSRFGDRNFAAATVCVLLSGVQTLVAQSFKAGCMNVIAQLSPVVLIACKMVPNSFDPVHENESLMIKTHREHLPLCIYIRILRVSCSTASSRLQQIKFSEVSRAA